MEQNKPLVITIEGPTAIGKTGLSITLAKHFGCSVLSADARQCYREMRIGVARPEPEELNAVPHFFVADRSVTEAMSAGSFEREGLALLSRLFTQEAVAIVCGGSGLYVKALVEGLDRFPPVTPEARALVREWYADGGLPKLQRELENVDPLYFRQVDRENPHRLIRALEVSRSSGKPYSAFRLERRAARPFDLIRLVIKSDRETLYRNIEARVDRMMASGLLEEVRELLPYRNLSPLQTVGYSELFAHLEGQLSLLQAVAVIKTHTRRYAKRQLTWLRAQSDLHPVEAGDPARAIAYLRERIGNPS